MTTELQDWIEAAEDADEQVDAVPVLRARQRAEAVADRRPARRVRGGVRDGHGRRVSALVAAVVVDQHDAGIS